MDSLVFFSKRIHEKKTAKNSKINLGIDGTHRYDFVPTVFDQQVVDVWYKTNDKESFECGRKLMRNESLLVGGSSGTILSVALKEAKKMPAGTRVAMIFPDSIRNYMTKYLSNDWMIENNFMEDPLDQVSFLQIFNFLSPPNLIME